MPFSQTMPGSPITTASPASVDSPTLPRTPETNDGALPSMDLAGLPITNAQEAVLTGAQAAAAAAAKRKTSRRANTAERRATHNAVERQRRETLNGRFLDLAALLPNLSQIRRPSKSAIVNSSIAHIHASRRHRMLASRELRLIKMEADALRREINQWRDRAGVPCMDEPVRSDAFSIVLAGELEIEPDLLMMEQAGYDAEDLYEDGEDGDYFGGAPMQTPMAANSGGMGAPLSHGGILPSPGGQSDEHTLMLKQAAAAQGNPFAHGPPSSRPSLNIRTGPTHPSQAMLASPLTGGYGSVAELGAYESHRLNPYGHPAHSAPHAIQYVHSPSGLLEAPGQEPKWGMHPHLGLGHGGVQAGMFTPPESAHGMDRAAYASLLQQRMLAQQQQQQQAGGHAYGSPVDGDDGASVGSAPGSAHGGAAGLQRRPRSGSAASSSVAGSYEPAGGLADYGAQGMGGRLRDRAMSVSAAGVGGWPNEQGMMKSSPVAIPNGGNMGMGMNAAFAMML